MRVLIAALTTALAALGAGTGANVTFDKDVLPILQKNCQACHRPGEIGPMALLDYKDTRPWAKAIKNAVLTRKMPPWFADSRFGHFANDRRLSDPDIATISAWVVGRVMHLKNVLVDRDTDTAKLIRREK